jgi:hypothetical protein
MPDVILTRIGNRRKTLDELFHAAKPAVSPSLGIQIETAPQAESGQEISYAIHMSLPTFSLRA